MPESSTKASVIVRQAVAADLSPITALESLCFEEEAFSRRQIRYLITKAQAACYVVEEEGHICAYMILLNRKSSTRLRLYSIAVAPGHRGKGVARLLLEKAAECAKMNGKAWLCLEVSERNKSAISLYLRSGFETYGERKAYYKDGSKALLMRKPVG
jgi:ribosomal protein S18 acetylase RimI-like enzyme